MRTLVMLGMVIAGAATAVLAGVGIGAVERSAAPRGAQAADDPTPDPSSDGPRALEEYAFWGHDRHGAPLRWDACTPIEFVLSARNAPEHAHADLMTALDRTAAASGLELRFAGWTDERPSADRPLVERTTDGWRWKPVLVAWALPQETDLPLARSDRGVAVPVAVRDGDREAFVTGQIVINAARTDLVAGFADRSDSVGATLLHEIGHVLGLAHVRDRRQIMSGEPGFGPVEFGAGDLAGLNAIGSTAGCNPAPSPSAGRGLTTTR